MADVGTLIMKVDADTKKFERGMERSKKAFKGMTKAVKVGALAASAAMVAIGAKSIKLAQEQELAEARLESIAKKVTKATDAQVQSLKDLAAATQEVTTFGDEVLITGQSQLLSFGLQAEQVEQLTGSLADLLAANKGIDATSQDAIDAANLLGKAFSGQAGSLSRVGIILDDTQAEILKTGTASEKTAALVQIMDQNYGGLAETLAKTTAGQMKQAKNAIGDIGERLGTKLLPILTKVLNWVTRNLPKIEKFFTAAFDFVLLAFSYASDFISNTLMPIFKKLFNVVSENAPGISEVFTTVFDAVVLAATTVWKFFQDNLLPIFEDIFKWVEDNMPTFKSIFEDVFEASKEVADNLIVTIRTLWGVFEILWDIVGPILEKLAPLVADAFTIMSGMILDATNNLLDFILAFEKVEELRNQDPFYKTAVDWAARVLGEKGEMIKQHFITPGSSGGSSSQIRIPKKDMPITGDRTPTSIPGITPSRPTGGGGGGNLDQSMNGGIQLIVTGNTIMNERDANRVGQMLVSKLKMAGVRS